MGMSTIREEIGTFVRSVLAEFLDEEIDETLDWNTPVGETGLGIESIGMLEVVVQLEREYDINLPDEVVERMVSTTFGGLVDEVAALLSAPASESRVA